jgi:excisionase family DNA binding protein
VTVGGLSGAQGAVEAVEAPRMAVVTPYVAKLLLAQLERAGWGSSKFREQAALLRSLGQPGLAREVEFAVSQLRAAAAEHQRVVSASGSASAEIVPEAARCASRDEVPVKEAAVMLSVSERRVRQWLEAGALRGRKVGRAWLVDAGAVETMRDVRVSA